MKFKFNSMKFSFNSVKIPTSIQWKFIHWAEHLGWNIRELARGLPAILANKTEESLWSLADLLGECSRLVSQVLAGSSSSSNENAMESVTQGVSGNNFSSTSNVSSAVKRARSMLQRSRSTGLCSARVNESDFKQHHLLPYLVQVEERNQKQLQNCLNRLKLL